MPYSLLILFNSLFMFCFIMFEGVLLQKNASNFYYSYNYYNAPNYYLFSIR